MQDQVWQGNGPTSDSFDFSGAAEASYRVKIEGCLLDDEAPEEEKSTKPTAADAATTEDNDDKMDEDTATNEKSNATSRKLKLSHFFKAMTVDFDRSRFRNGAEQSVEWKKPDAALRQPNGPNLPASADFDEIAFKRNGDENINITINLFRQEIPERYQFNPELADVIDMKEGTQQEAVMGFWEYIRQRGLQEDEEKRNFRCDELLKKVRFLLIDPSHGETLLYANDTKGRERRCWLYPNAKRIRGSELATSPPCCLAIHYSCGRRIPQKPTANYLRCSSDYR